MGLQARPGDRIELTMQIQNGAGYLPVTAQKSYLLTGISQCYLGVMKVSEHPREAANISIFAVVLNIALNALLIYGIGFFPRMDPRGAALATVRLEILCSSPSKLPVKA